MGAKNRIENVGEGSRSMRKMFQGPVRDKVRDRSLADLETPDCFLNLIRGG
jgi:hypothetical protein